MYADDGVEVEVGRGVNFPTIERPDPNPSRCWCQLTDEAFEQV
jgi:hypothetical protein